MTQDNLPSFAVVIPMYNEEKGAEFCVQSVSQELDRMPHHTALIVVEDGSSDSTASIIRSCQSYLSKVVVVQHEVNKGYGAALQTGSGKAGELGFDYVIFMDSDMTNDPKDFSAFSEKMAQSIDVIKASRYIPGGHIKKDVPFLRRFMSWSGNVIGRVLFGMGIKDCTNGFRAVKTDILSRLDLSENSFEIIVEELYQCKFYAKTFSEVPVELGNRTLDQRGTSFSYGPKTFYTYLKYAFLAFLKIRPKNYRIGDGV